ncbi:MAG: MBL fold metallo-hydrolase [Lentisphaerae bacterium]|jgi:ribonuclease J|nr:MBL fold metallo-hydrolase [Lentisphaerota bacterium]
MTEVTIHRGTHAIGGSCVEVRSNGHRLIIDLGLPLMGKDGAELNEQACRNPSVANGVLPDVDGLYEGQTSTVDAVLLSHAHLDHYGLLDWVHPQIPVWLSKESQALIEVGSVFWPPELAQRKFATHCRNFDHWKPFQIGPFTITSLLMDHSAFGASSLLIEVAGKRIFYSGDLRGHGRKAKLFQNVVRTPVRDVDCLIMEGTTLGSRSRADCLTELDVEKRMYEVFAAQQDASFVLAAGSNVDRLVSTYKAAKRAGKTLVLDLYQIILLDRLKEFAPGLPPHPGDGIRVMYFGRHTEAVVDRWGVQTLYDYKPRKIGVDEILADRQNMVLRIPLSRMKRIAEQMRTSCALDKAHMVYSMWSGYLKKNPAIQGFCTTFGTGMLEIHTSGHAYLRDLKRLATALNPKVLLPIHTLSGDEFKRHFANVVRIDDGKAFML